MYDSIVLYSFLFGSIYIFSKSLELMNSSILENKLIPRKLIVMNGLMFIMSGSLILYTFNSVNLHKFKFLRVKRALN